MGDLTDHHRTDRPWTAQPLPVGGTGPIVHDLAIDDLRASGWHDLADDMAERLEFGRRKYGNDGLRCHDGRNTVADALEECLDLAVYLRKAIAEGTPGLGNTYRTALATCRLLRDRLQQG